MTLLRLADWVFNTADGTLTSASTRKRLEPKAQSVLQLLIDRRGTVVSHEEILRAAWHETHVAHTALPRVISILRQALDDDVRRPRYIETVPKRGYRWVASVETCDAPTPESQPIDAAPASRPTFVEATLGKPRWPRYVLAGAATIALALAIGHDALFRSPVSTLQTTVESDSAQDPFRNTSLWHDSRLGNEAAFEHYTREVAQHPSSADALAGLATVYAFRAAYRPDRAEWANAAVRTAERASAMDPSNWHAVRALAISEMQAGRLADATRDFERALELRPRDHPSRTNLGYVLTATGRLDAALRVFAEHRAVWPDWPALYSFPALALAIAGYEDEGVRLAAMSIDRKPLLVESHLVLVRVDLVHGRYEAAQARLQRLLEVNPDCQRCVTLMGLAAQMQGRLDDARDHYEHALEMQPGFGESRLRLAQVRLLEHDSAGARTLVADFERWIQLGIDQGVDNPQLPWYLAAAAALSDDPNRAMHWYARAVEAGHRDVIWDMWDPALAALRREPDFVRLSDRIHADHRRLAPLAARLAR
jgi:transcriptional activator of cad operon